MQQIVLDTNRQIKVNSICCYICGREFGTKGFPFHYKECLVKFGNQQKLKAPNDRIKLPSPPEELNQVLTGDFSKIDLRKFNQQSNSLFKYKVLPACKYCKRTFNYESLAVHMKGCAKKPAGYQEKQNEVISNNSKIPKALVCCVCGQRFGTSSLRIHYPECVKKFKNEEIRKHKKQSDRRSPPEFTTQDVAALFKQEWTPEQMEDFNNRATENYRSHGMAECYNCGRKFFFEQLDKHRKNCQLINGKLNKGKAKADKDEKVLKIAKPKTITCIVCGRDYGTTSISIHITQCQQLFKKQQENKDKSQRKKLPSLNQEQKAQYDLKNIEEWSRQKIQTYNKIVFDIYNNKSLSKCFICQRTFFEESLPKHLKDCQSKLKDVKKLQKFKKQIKSNKSFFGDNFLDNVMEMNRQISTPQIKQVNKPRVLMCLFCGKQYGMTSLKIHIKRCRGQQNEKKAELVKSLDQIKEKYNIQYAQKWSDEEIKSYNSEVYEIYKVKSLFQCKYCHRTFFEESLKKHIKHCEKQNGKRSLKRSKTMGQMTISQEKLIEQQKELHEIEMTKKQSEPVIIEEENEEQDQNYHALEYGKLMNQEEQSLNISINEDLMDIETNHISMSMPVIEIEDY